MTLGIMPELGEQMYCSEQICIPPAFPYLLRQFAKAAIRTQPTDLLRWSTAYFRCLSLNIPPPVKPRLEYPIPRDHCGVTPGWLKALMYQLQNNLTVSFKILWDRWTGACLEHSTLIQILCLGGFTDPEAIPWLRFVGLCAAHLTDDLTHTMILICEIMTEEPDGGSAMVPLETFTDLYTFLANIDASKPQVLKNNYFTDAHLTIWKQSAEKEEGQGREVKEESITEEERDQESMAADVATVPREIKEREGEEEEGAEEENAEGYEQGEEEEEDDHKSAVAEEEADEAQAKEVEEEETKEEEEKLEEVKEEEVVKRSAHKVEATPVESVDTIQEEPRRIEPDVIEDAKMLQEDLEKLHIMQTEIEGETDSEVEKYKCRLIEEMPLSKSQEEAVLHFKDMESKSDLGSVELKSEAVEEEEEEKSEDVYVDKIHGIGSIVPEKLIEAVCTYMKGVAKLQHGMVMPRNIRHYNCPPLEVLEY